MTLYLDILPSHHPHRRRPHHLPGRGLSAPPAALAPVCPVAPDHGRRRCRRHPHRTCQPELSGTYWILATIPGSSPSS